MIGTARDLDRAERACAPVREAAALGGGGLTLVALDLADLSSVAAQARIRSSSTNTNR